MRNTLIPSICLAAAMMAGCSPPAAEPVAGIRPHLIAAPGAATATARYVIKHATASPVAIAGVAASSSTTRDPRWWRVANVNDGNQHSAWAPDGGDPAPALQLDLGGVHAVTALAVKMDEAPTSFDVQARTGAGWTTIAQSVRPARYQMLDFIALPDVETDALRLVFDAGDAQLLVCEVEVFEGRDAHPHIGQGDCIRLAGTADLGADEAGPDGQPALQVTLADVRLSGGGVSGTITLVRPSDGAELTVPVSTFSLEHDVLTLRGTVEFGGQIYDLATTLRLCECSEEGPLTASVAGVVVSVGGDEALSATAAEPPVCGIAGVHGACP